MTEEERDATGNDIPSEGDLPETEESPAPEGESRERESDPTDWKKKYLEAKTAEEEANRLRRENEELRASRQPPPAADDDDDPDALSPEEELALASAARKGDVYAKALIRDRKEREQDREERDDLVRGIVLRDQANADRKSTRLNSSHRL